MEKIHTVDEVAEILNVHPNTVRLWLKNYKMKGVKMGRNWRVKESQLEEFLKEQEGGIESK